MTNKDEKFGTTIGRILTSTTDENTAWREIVRAHIRLGIDEEDELVIQAVKWLVDSHFRARKSA